VKLYGLPVGESMLFSQKGSPESGFAVVVELLVGEPGEDGGLADS
jgi:hypothetical protein